MTAFNNAPQPGANGANGAGDAYGSAAPGPMPGYAPGNGNGEMAPANIPSSATPAEGNKTTLW